MKVLLIFPPFPRGSYAVKVQPLGLALLHANLENSPDTTVEVMDLNVNARSISQIITKVREESWDVVGISYMTPQATFTRALSTRLRRECPDVVIVHGGAHPTCRPHEAMKFSDFVVVGEGDISFIRLLEALKKREEPPCGVWGRWKGESYTDTVQEFVKDLDALPFPQRVSEGYNHTIHVVPGYAAPLLASRGCPNACSFCCSPKIWKQTIRYRSPASVLREIRELVEEGTRKFHFYDDDFLLNPAFVRTLCTSIVAEDLSIQWVCLASTRSIKRNAALLDLMVRAGCVGIEVGIESGDPGVLVEISKPQRVPEIEEAVKILHKKGVTILPLFMTFNPGETLEGHRNQKLFLDTLFTERKGVSLVGGPRRKAVYLGQFATPYPGSRFFETRNTTGITLCHTWSGFISTKINFVPHSLLQDCPKCDSLDAADYIEVLDALFYKFPSAFEPRRKGIKRAYFITQALKTFFSLCNGKKTLEECAMSFEKIYGCRRETALKFAAITSVIAAQCGLLFSRETEETEKGAVNLYYCFYLLYVWLCLHLPVRKKSVKNAVTAVVG